MNKLLLIGAIAGAGMSIAATQASARVVCNDEGDCWRTRTEYQYPPSVRLQFYNDDYKWGDHEKRRWREHDGRGYWRNGIWVEF